MKRTLLLLLGLALLPPTPVVAEESPIVFPLQGILPKQETGALRFLEEHPEYDGRGVVVAIFDTGVDPGAAGLQVTSDGKPKIVDMVDGSGSGDVDTSTVRQAEKGMLEGLSGRRLKLGKDWENPSGDYHVGIKRAYELFPGSLVGRIKTERSREWDRKQRAALTREERTLAAFDRKHPRPDRERKKEREELEQRVAQLKAMQKQHEDPGPIYDCVVFHDGEVWRAAIDTDEDGDLGDERLLTNYRRERGYATFSSLDLLNFAVNIYEEGRLLSIVTDAGAHGTHVAGIVAANFPDRPEANGVAPGAQIVSVKIGDTRMGSSSMGTGETRGLIAVLENECDLINMSYGGATAEPNHERHARLFSEIVNKHGVIFVASAGNSGPALSTVGSPGGTTSAIIGVGAYVSPEMMAAQYSLRKELPEINYTWTSRGPTFDGDLGVNICAPGGAIAPVSNWTLQGNMLMNGTSMSSPNACGGIALLLSGLKAGDIGYTPHRVRRAVENTARKVDEVEVFAQGRGLLQVDKAFQYLKDYESLEDQDLRFEVDFPGNRGARGIYLRESFELERPHEATARVRPVFHEDADNRDKVRFEMRFQLECEADWVSHPEFLVMMHGGRTFEIAVDGSELEPGTHYTEVAGLDTRHPDRGPVFRIPVTVVVPEEVESEGLVAWRSAGDFEPGRIRRHFLQVPHGAEWADLVIRTRSQDGSRRLVVHTAQRVPGNSFQRNSVRNFITLKPEDRKVHSFPVVGGRTLELCLAQYWSSLGEGSFEFELSFHGIVPDNRDLFIDGADTSTRIDFSAPFQDETVAPSASVKTLRQTLPPDDFASRPLNPERDRLPDERQIHEGVLTYKFKLDSKAKITPRFGLSDEFESNIWMLYDANKKLVKAGSSGRSVDLGKGGYVLKYHVRHDRPERIGGLKKLPLLLDRSLEKNLNIGFHLTHTDALTGGGKYSSTTLPRGERGFLYAAISGGTPWPKAAKPGDLLVGRMTFGKKEGSEAGAGQRPGGYSVTVRVPPVAEDKKDSTPKSQDKDKSEKEKLKEAVRDLKVERLGKLYGDKHEELFRELASEILEEWPDHLPVHVHRLKRLDQDKTRKQHLGAVIEAADEILERIDTEKLRSHYGINLDSEDEEAVELRKEMDQDKAILTDTLYRKGRAIAYAESMREEADAKQAPKEKTGKRKRKAKSGAPSDEGEKDTKSEASAGEKDKKDKKQKPKSRKAKDAGGKKGKKEASTDEPKTPEIPDIDPKAFDENFDELRKWVDTTDAKYILLHIRNERRQERFGVALKHLNQHLKDAKPEERLFDKRIKILGKLGWEHWADYDRNWNLLRFPADYQPF